MRFRSWPHVGGGAVADQDEYMTTEEVAKLARTSPATVRYWRHRGAGPNGFLCGRRVLYARADVERWLKGLRTAEARVAG
ncbi:MAG: helix-turn-helix domain-containing protein [Pseudonocardiaceae bacterium]